MLLSKWYFLDDPFDHGSVSRAMAQNQDIEIRGVIIATAWDRDGRVLTTSLAGVDEQEYHLLPGQLATELLGLVQKEVVVKGRMLLLADGRKQLSVESLRLHVQAPNT